MRKKKTLMHSIVRARYAWNEHVRELTLSLGVPDSYRPVIMFLYHHPGSTQRSIAEYADVTASAINQAVKSMLRDGYLYKENDNCDKRSYKLFLTEKGEHIASQLKEKLNQSDTAITNFVGKEQEEELMELLQQLTDFIRKEL